MATILSTLGKYSIHTDGAIFAKAVEFSASVVGATTISMLTTASQNLTAPLAAEPSALPRTKSRRPLRLQSLVLRQALSQLARILA